MTHLLTGPWGFLPATPEELSATGVVLAVATGLTLDLLGRPALIDGELTSWTSQTLLFLVIAGVIIIVSFFSFLVIFVALFFIIVVWLVLIFDTPNSFC